MLKSVSKMAQNLQKSTRHYDTIVVGAGTAGLACAARLFQHRARKHGSVAVLEARDRIGGRVNSVHVNGNRLDTGVSGYEQCSCRKARSFRIPFPWEVAHS